MTGRTSTVVRDETPVQVDQGTSTAFAARTKGPVTAETADLFVRDVVANLV
jgi:hypothetical protein